MDTDALRSTLEARVYRALLLRLLALTPSESDAGRLLLETRPLFDPYDFEAALGAIAPLGPDDPAYERDGTDPIAHATQHSPTARALLERQQERCDRIRGLLHPNDWQHVLDLEHLAATYRSWVEHAVFAHAFRLGQLWPPSPPSPTGSSRSLKRLARAAADLRSPPGLRLRVLLAASLQALEELFPPNAAPSPISGNGAQA